MKKYIQITIVLGLFFLLVLFRQLHGSDAAPVVTPPSNQSSTGNSSGNSSGNQSNSGSTGSGSNQSNQSTGNSALYKDGKYTGNVADAYYGNIQVQVTISGGKITDVQFLQYPNDNGTSQMINSQAMPYLRQEAIAAQSANVDIVSGASDSSQAFQQSLSSALSQAH